MTWPLHYWFGLLLIAAAAFSYLLPLRRRSRHGRHRRGEHQGTRRQTATGPRAYERNGEPKPGAPGAPQAPQPSVGQGSSPSGAQRRIDRSR